MAARILEDVSGPPCESPSAPQSVCGQPRCWGRGGLDVLWHHRAGEGGARGGGHRGSPSLMSALDCRAHKLLRNRKEMGGYWKATVTAVIDCAVGRKEAAGDESHAQRRRPGNLPSALPHCRGTVGPRPPLAGLSCPISSHALGKKQSLPDPHALLGERRPEARGEGSFTSVCSRGHRSGPQDPPPPDPVHTLLPALGQVSWMCSKSPPVEVC
ncbi:Hypothetical predicted protein [Lynx pardinus]|uniref:Uncharacterized protein n=1 Tax=Lynx pardinus TaxID=191816 RepID=A0A485PH96_LYNPA|nr:Hypothetical predicted protein [Lynx pardinus]